MSKYQEGTQKSPQCHASKFSCAAELAGVVDTNLLLLSTIGMSNSGHSWYSDCQPGLLSNKVLRQFLARFSEAVWPEVVKLTAVYGALSLEQVQGKACISVEDIKAAIDTLSVQRAIQDSMPGLQAQVQALSTSLAEISGSLPAYPRALNLSGMLCSYTKRLLLGCS